MMQIWKYHYAALTQISILCSVCQLLAANIDKPEACLRLTANDQGQLELAID